MKKLFVITFSFFSLSILSQSLDEAYLQSLPDNVRNDVINSIDEQQTLSKPIYRRQSTMIDKQPTETKSIRFGDSMFKAMQSSFMPINEPNFDSSYILDFGDVLELQLIGQKNYIEVLPIKRDGSINIPEIGKVFISGISLDDANKLIKSKVTNAYIGVEAFVSLVNIRDIQVLITGNAYNPGIYTLNGNSNILHALNMAGGVDENGSYRQIDLIRDDKLVISLDLYDIFIKGKANIGERLRSGDIILIKPATRVILLSGAFKRNGLYELVNDEGFTDLIEFGNGLIDAADINNIRIERPQGNKVKLIKVESLDELALIEPQSSDRLYAKAFERRTVDISGAVNMPGMYVIDENETVLSLLKKAGGYQNNAYPFGAILNNKKALQLSQSSVNKLYRNYIQKLITKGDALFASESLPFILDELKKAEVTGRLIAEFDIDVLNADITKNTLLEDGDQIIIPRMTQQVYIFGQVNNDGAVRYKPNESISDYIERAGGASDIADLKNIYVVHPNGEVERLNKRLSILANTGNNHYIYPGSVIYVPRKVKSRELSLIASIWAPIISATATSITALTVLDNQNN